MRNCVDSCTELSRSLWLRSSLSSSPGSAWPLQVPGLMLASILGLGPHTTITIPVPAPLRTHTQSPPFISELCGATVRNTGLWNKIWLNYWGLQRNFLENRFNIIINKGQDSHRECSYRNRHASYFILKAIHTRWHTDTKISSEIRYYRSSLQTCIR